MRKGTHHGPAACWQLAEPTGQLGAQPATDPVSNHAATHGLVDDQADQRRDGVPANVVTGNALVHDETAATRPATGSQRARKIDGSAHTVRRGQHGGRCRETW